MPEVTLTEQQKKAVDCRDKQLIVSAAAGSGKTAVLVQRVMSLLCDPERPCGVDQLLIVTFTNAAAAEMRSRIGQELGRRLAEAPGDRNLRRQLALLPTSRIQTVHGFCQSLLREQFHLCGISPDFRLADETECTLLKQNAMATLLEEAYQAGDAAFLALGEMLSDQRSDRPLEAAVLEIYEKLRSHPDPAAWLDWLPTSYRGEPEESAWGRMLLSDAGKRAEQIGKRLTAALVQMENRDAALLQIYGPAFSGCADFCEELGRAVSAGWEAASRLLSGFAMPRLGSKRSEDKLFREEMKAVFDRCKKELNALQKSGISVPLEIVRRELRQNLPLAESLCALVRRFGQLYQEEKQAGNLLDFSDLEHKALELLSRDRQPTPLALELRRELREILVDEYQDTNEIQERLFEALLPENGSAFFVGDVKQSIYRFRLADPTIFRSRYEESAPYGGDGDRWRLELNRNFRSRKEVLELCNFVFSRVMSGAFGDVEYDEGQRLVPGLSQEGTVPSELLVLSGKGEDEDTMQQREARLVAARVRELLDTALVGEDRPCRPEDIAILLSSYKNKAPAYQQALGALSIPCAAADSGGFFESLEISVMLSLLRVLDNRQQDIPLISLLRSPLYLFTPDQLGRIRMAEEGDFYQALEQAAAAGDGASRQVLEDLDCFSRLAEDRSVAQLLRELYRRTNALGLFAALDGGAQRRQNLEQLYQMALRFETSGVRGLHAFLRRIDRKLAAGEAVAAKAAPGGVQIMSVHRSKGLEFPIVILPDLKKAFNTDDLKKPVLFHPDVGIGLPLRESALRVQYKTQLQAAIALRLQRELRSEELRKLYVAMTRAKERLILVIAGERVREHLQELAWDAHTGVLDPDQMAACSCAADWILSALLTHPAAGALRSCCTGAFTLSAETQAGGLVCRLLSPEDIPEVPPYRPEAAHTAPEDIRDARLLLEQSLLRYPHLAAAALPSKLTPTGAAKLSPDTATAAGTPREVKVHLYQERPKTAEDAARRGTAFHRALQYLEPGQCGDGSGLHTALQALTASGRLTEEQLALVEEDRLLAFLQSPLAQRIQAADRVLREYEFGALLPADRILHNGVSDRILLNGAMDLLLFEGESLTIVDFKSDRVTEKSAPARAEQHRLQLELYAMAAEEIFGKPVKECWVWFLSPGCGICLTGSKI